MRKRSAEFREGRGNVPKTLLIGITTVVSFCLPLGSNLDVLFQGYNTWHSFQYLFLLWVRASRSVLRHLRQGRQKADEPARVGHLVGRRVQMDQPAGSAESAGTVRKHDVAVPGQRTRLGIEIILRTAEAVRQQDGRSRRMCWNIDRGVQRNGG